jgi:hypothetical protein
MDTELGDKTDMPEPLKDLAPLLKNIHEEVLMGMLRNESIMSARRKGYKRDRVIGRSKWTWRKNAKLGQLAERLGIMRQLDYIRWLVRTANSGFHRTDSDYCVCRHNDPEFPPYPIKTKIPHRSRIRKAH